MIEVFSEGTLTGVNTLDSYYQGNNYSYLTCPIIEGTDLLNKNNTWTGTNSFTAGTTVPTLTFPNSTTNAVNASYLTTNYASLTTANTLSGINTFSTSPLNTESPVLPTTENSTKIPNTQWVKSLGYLTSTLASTTYASLTGANTLSGINTFSTQPTMTATLLGTDNSTNISTTKWVKDLAYLTIASASSTYLTTALGVALAGAQSITGLKSFTSPIGLGSVPTLSTQLGFKYNTAVTFGVATASPYTIASISILTAGIYIFTIQLQTAYTGTPTNIQFELTGTNAPLSNFGRTDITTSNFGSAGTVIVTCTVSSYTIKLTYAGVSLSNVFANMSAVRIA